MLISIKKKPCGFVFTLPLLLFLVFLAAPGPVDAGDWRIYTAPKELPSNKVQALAYREDPLDFPPCDSSDPSDCPRIPGLWVGSDQGLTYLNGRDSVTFDVNNLPSPDVRDLLFEPDGRLWIATAKGLAWLDDNRTPDDFGDDRWNPQPILAGHMVAALAQTDDGRLWAGTDAGLMEIDSGVGRTLYTHLSGVHITALPACPFSVASCKVGADNNLWIGTDCGLYRLDLSKDSATPEPFGVDELPSRNITAMALAENGVWVGTDKGAMRWDGGQWTNKFTGPGNLASHDVRDIDLDDRGGVWFATAAGASRWDPTRNTWRRVFAFRDPLTDDNVRTMLIDLNGSVWLGADKGLNGWNNSWELLNSTTMYDGKAPLVSNFVTEFAVNGVIGHIWVGTRGGITVFDKDLSTIISLTTMNSILRSDDITALAVDSLTGNTWVGASDGGVVVFDRYFNAKATFSTDRNILPSNDVNALAIDSRAGNMWVGTNDGVVVFNQNLLVKATLTKDRNNLPSNNVKFLAVDNRTGNTWVGADGEGVAVFDLDFKAKAAFTTDRNILPSDYVKALAVDYLTGYTWVGTRGGVVVFDQDLQVKATFTKDHNTLPDNNVMTLAVNNRTGYNWVATSRSVVVFNQDLQVKATFTTDNNIFPDIYVMALAVDNRTGYIWVGTRGGVTVFDQEMHNVDRFSNDNGLSTSASVVAIVLDPENGRTWAGSFSGYVTLLNENMQTTGTIAAKGFHLLSNGVQALAFDNQTGHMWVKNGYLYRQSYNIGFFHDFSDRIGEGLTILDNKLNVLDSFTNEKVAHDAGRALAVNSRTGKIWVGTYDEGLIVLDRGLNVEASLTTENDDLPSNQILALAVDNRSGRTWVGTEDGVTVFDHEFKAVTTLTAEGDGLPSNEITALAVDNITNRIWVGTWDGLAVVDRNIEVEATFSTGPSSLPSDEITAIAVDNRTGRAWVGTRENDLFVFGKSLQIEAIFNIGENPTFFRGVFDLAVDSRSGRTWVGTQGGVLMFASQGQPPWVEPTLAMSRILKTKRLLDIRELKFTFIGGSLMAPPLELKYNLLLENLKTGEPFSETMDPGDVGAASPGLAHFGKQEPLDYGPHRLTVTVSDSDLKSYTLPPMEFDVQASPRVSLLSLAGIAHDELSEETVFTSEEPLSIALKAEDDDAEPGEKVTVQYSRNYRGDADEANWRSAAEGTGGKVVIPPLSLSRGGPNETRSLAVRIIDVDGNPSQPVTVPLTFSVPISFVRLLAYFFVVGGLGLAFLGAGLATLSRASDLSFGLLLRQGVKQWIPVGLGYRRYRSRWLEFTPLERLLILLAPSTGSVTLEDFQNRLNQHKIPVAPDRLERALEELTRRQFLHQEGGRYQQLEPGLVRALRLQEVDAGLDRLADLVRDEHPLFAETRRFFSAAGFELADVPGDPMAFLCRPASSILKGLFNAPVYSRLLPDQLLDRKAVTDLHRAARGVAEPGAVLFAIVDQTPPDDGWIEIGALKAGEGVQIIPIDDAMIQRGRVRQKERDILQRHLRRFLRGRRDLYNVRDPVADRLNFFGREIRAAELLETLEEGRPLALFGLRKMGKSSMLHYLRDQAPFPAAYVDLDTGLDLGPLYNNILKSCRDSLRAKIEGFEWDPPDLPAADPSSAFTTAVRDLMDRMEQNGHAPRLGFFIDEVELIAPRERERGGGLDPQSLARFLSFGRAMRGLVQETGRLSLLVVGVDPHLIRVSRWAGQQNPLYQLFHEEYLGPLGRDDCIRMIRNIGRQMNLVYGDGADRFVAESSGGHPFLARQLCSVTYRALKGKGAGVITLGQLEEAAGRFISDPELSCFLDGDGLWGDVTSPDLWPKPEVLENEALLTSLAEVERQSEEALLNAAMDPRARERSLFELERRAVLGRMEDSLNIQFGLFRDWIRRYIK